MRAADFPLQYARSRRFSLGVPRSFRVSPDGSRVAFLRSRGAFDPVNCLWTISTGNGEEYLQVDPRQLEGALGSGDAEELAPQERARRERARERGSGITRYGTDVALERAAFVLSGQLWLADLATGRSQQLDTPGLVVEARPSPSGAHVAYVEAGSLRVIKAGGDGHRLIAAPESPQVTYGLPEFVAAEEMSRSEGYWWSPDGKTLLVARVDNSPVARWYISDPADPASAPQEIAYPVAGSTNAEVTLWLMSLDGSREKVAWDPSAGFEYLVAARWSEQGLLVVVQSRDQRRMRVVSVDPASGSVTVVREDSDSCWVPIGAGVPDLTCTGELVWCVERAGARRLLIGDRVITPDGLQVEAVQAVDGETVLFTARQDPTELHLWVATGSGELARLTTQPGVYSGWRAGGTTVVVSRSLDYQGSRVKVFDRDGHEVSVASWAEDPVLEPQVELLELGERALRAALLLPTWHPRRGSLAISGPAGFRPAGDGPLPVLLDPYGGPLHQRVVAAADSYLVSQWFAEQGFAVLVVDGRGTPGRGPEWERAIRGDFSGPVLDDQVEALQVLAESRPGLLDLSRVAIRGWSFGGYLAALAVLRRPDVFHAAVSGAPVTDHRLYDTHYEERYLGHPDLEPENYERSSLIADAGKLTRPLLIIHGLADDNVVVAHSLQLSTALLAAGRPHAVLPLSGVTHMASAEVVAEKLLLLELDFLQKALGLSAGS